MDLKRRALNRFGPGARIDERGKIFCDWPGLSDAALFEDRDLKPTLDTRAVLKAAIVGTFDLTPAPADRVFPDLSGAPGVYELMR